jgi:AcrR family transcriptional regulator
MTPPRDRPTFTEAARRQQIIDAALQTIAEQGYTQASFAEIARSLGITKGLIAYHFDGKHDLITSTIQTLLSRQSAYVKARVAAHHDAAGRMQAYIAASFDYIAQHRAHVAALVDLWGSFTSPLEKVAFSQTAYEPCRAHLRAIMRAGFEQGAFVECDPTVMAAVIQAGIDGVMLQWVFDPTAVDLAAASHELQTMVMQRIRR